MSGFVAVLSVCRHPSCSRDCVHQVPAIGVSEYESFLHRVWQDVSGIEYVEERPRVRVTPTNIDFEKLPCVRARPNLPIG